MVKNQHEYAYLRRKKIRKQLFSVLLCIIIVFSVIQLIFSFLLRPVSVKTSGMSPSIEPASVLFVAPKSNERPSFMGIDSLDRGDVVFVKDVQKDSVIKVFFHEIAEFFMLQKEDDFSYDTVNNGLYRLVALPGDQIYIKDYILYIKRPGEIHFLTEFEIIDKEYDIYLENIPSKWDLTLGVPGVMAPMTLQDDQYFVLSDNRISAIDSRFFGPVQGESLRGKAIMQYFPLSKLALF